MAENQQKWKHTMALHMKNMKKQTKTYKNDMLKKIVNQLRMGGNQSKRIPRQSFPSSAYRLNMSALFTLTTDQTIWTPLIPESGTFGN